ncbi:hypothetical protein GT347_03270 [Xylophilus rhododendri]|uniref:Uncharacterized protein n=1 Tax=Xylophilus rhododendri TaxID=2697032 RepID=A0A857J1R0_9BURK|nr:hypothetical protein [Xylophilus rhododendri]QHI97089.1 hypothetical protein GT347_03270 [Xylophilus rhododendri]
MTSDWHNSDPHADPARPATRGRTDFQDSLLAARREEQAQEKRRSQAIAEALRARGLASDPDGSQFRAAQQKAIAARRADNARLEAERQAKRDTGFTLSQLDAWEDAPVKRRAKRLSRPMWLLATLVASGAVALATLLLRS